jgi:hypothetical protein
MSSGAMAAFACARAKDVAETVVHPVGDEDAHRDEGEELHDRLESDCSHQPLVPLGRVEVARAEEDREGGEQHRDVERVVAEETAARPAGSASRFRGISG